MEFIKYLVGKVAKLGVSVIKFLLGLGKTGLKWIVIVDGAILQLFFTIWAVENNIWLLILEAIIVFVIWQYRKFKAEQSSNP